MRAHLVQMNIVWEDRHQNFLIVDRLIAHAKPLPGDLIVLPEMFDSGFSLRVERTSDAQRHTLDYLRRLALRTGCTVHGGRTVAGEDGQKATNRATIAGPDGEIIADYAKIHPFSFGREPEAFRGGDHVTVYPWVSGPATLAVCPAVCYDLRFPELFRLGLGLGAEAFALGANFPKARQAHWRALAIARSIENQAFVFAVNRTGSDPHLDYAGGSLAVGPKGEILGELGDDEAVLSVDVDPAVLHDWRAAFGAWRDVRIHCQLTIDHHQPFSSADDRPRQKGEAMSAQTAMFGAGCFWGVEHAFRQVEGVLDTQVGYAGGTTEHPTYEQVCTDQTGHAEVVRVSFDPARVTFDQLLDTFFTCHDPTQRNRQGPDIGRQYRSTIFFFDRAQQDAARARIDSMRLARPVVTEVLPAGAYYPAEELHQRYIEKNGGAACGI